jgi:heme/copper-type cytochrome/quinol oxidase subunit 3
VNRCTLNDSTAVAVYYEVVNQHANHIPAGQIFTLQFVTRYTHGSGQQRVRAYSACVNSEGVCIVCFTPRF